VKLARVIRLDESDLNVFETPGEAGEWAISGVTDLAEYFVSHYGAPDVEAARPVAAQELDHMRSMCDDQEDNALLVVSRELEEGGVREQFRVIPPSDAPLELGFAISVSLP